MPKGGNLKWWSGDTECLDYINQIRKNLDIYKKQKTLQSRLKKPWHKYDSQALHMHELSKGYSYA